MKWPSLVFAGALTYQAAHLVEHLAQVYQHGWLGLPILQSHGILFFMDLEWNHFIFTTLYFITLAIVFFGARLWRYRFSPAGSLPFWGFLVGGLGLEAYHHFEHINRIAQHITSGCQPCPGILGRYVDLIYLHFTFNALAFVFSVIVFFAYGFAKKALEIFSPANRGGSQ